MEKANKNLDVAKQLYSDPEVWAVVQRGGEGNKLETAATQLVLASSDTHKKLPETSFPMLVLVKKWSTLDPPEKAHIIRQLRDLPPATVPNWFQICGVTESDVRSTETIMKLYRESQANKTENAKTVPPPTEQKTLKEKPEPKRVLVDTEPEKVAPAAETLNTNVDQANQKYQNGAEKLGQQCLEFLDQIADKCLGGSAEAQMTDFQLLKSLVIQLGADGVGVPATFCAGDALELMRAYRSARKKDWVRAAAQCIVALTPMLPSALGEGVIELSSRIISRVTGPKASPA